MSSCQIRIEGVSGNCCQWQQVKVNRQQPEALKPHMPEANWEQLCDRADEAIAPLEVVRKRTNFILIFGLTSVIVLLALNAIGAVAMGSDDDVTTETDNNNNEGDDTDDSTGGSSALPITIAILFLLFFITVMGYACTIGGYTHQAHEQMRALCAELTHAYSNLTFQYALDQDAYARGMTGFYGRDPHIVVRVANVEPLIATAYKT